MAADYRVGIEIALMGTVQAQLAAFASRMLGLQTTAGAVTAEFGRWQTAIRSVGAILAGSTMIGAMKVLVEHGAALNHEFELMKISGMDMGEIMAANAKAAEVSSKILTTTESENRRHIRELRGAFGDTESAMKYLEPVVRAQAVINAVTGKQGDQIWEGVKGLEMKGVTMHPGEFEQFLSDMTAAVVMFGGKINFSDFFQAFKYGRTATYGWNEEFTTKYLPTLMQEFKSSSGGGGGVGGPGNALMSMYQTLVSGVIAKTAAEEFQRLGLLTDREYRPQRGSILGKVSPYGITGTAEFMKNPYQWTQEVLLPALVAHGFTTREEQTGEIARLFRARTAGAIATVMTTQGSRMEKDAALNRAVWADALAYGELAANDYPTAMLEFQQQWKRLLEVLGDPLVLPAAHALHDMADALASMSKRVGEHPEAVKIALEIFGGAAIGLIIAGITGLGVAIGAWVGLPVLIGSLVLAFGSLIALNWSSITGSINEVVAAIPGLFSRIGTALMDAIRAIVGSVTGMFTPPAAAAGAVTAPGPVWHPGAAPPQVHHGPGGGPLSPAVTGKQGYNAVPPPPTGSGQGGGGDVFLDGKKVGDILAGQLARSAGGPLQGSAYFDGTQGSPASDLSLSYG